MDADEPHSSVEAEATFADNADATDVLPYLSLALDQLGSQPGGQSDKVGSYRNMQAANDLVDDDATLPLPTLVDEANDIHQQPTGLWMRVRSYIGF